jgi:hypothetical protein
MKILIGDREAELHRIHFSTSYFPAVITNGDEVDSDYKVVIKSNQRLTCRDYLQQATIQDDTINGFVAISKNLSISSKRLLSKPARSRSTRIGYALSLFGLPEDCVEVLHYKSYTGSGFIVKYNFSPIDKVLWASIVSLCVKALMESSIRSDIHYVIDNMLHYYGAPELSKEGTISSLLKISKVNQHLKGLYSISEHREQAYYAGIATYLKTLDMYMVNGHSLYSNNIFQSFIKNLLVSGKL